MVYRPFVISIAFLILTPMAARADRSAAQGPSGLYLEKTGKFAEAALYYQRAGRGFKEVWIKFWHYGLPGDAHQVTRQIMAEYEARLESCLTKAAMNKVQREHMDRVNELWMGEYVDHELGGYKLAFAFRAEESEKHGDFVLASRLRSAAAEYCRLVAIPYHDRRASELEVLGQQEEAALHLNASTEYEQRALEHEWLARGDMILASTDGLQGTPFQVDLGEHYFNSYRVFHKRVLSVKDRQWITGRTPQQIAAILKLKGLMNAEENARFASVVVLANLGEKEALLDALADPSSRVQLAAAKALAATRWADGWAVCYRHEDSEVRDVVDRLLEPAGEQLLSRTASITELLNGLKSSSEDTRAFCQKALEDITGKKDMSGGAWRKWWHELGDAKPGLTRTGSSGSAVLDETIDHGTWWQSGERSIRNRPNPLSNYSLPAKIRWSGNLAVTDAGKYQFYVRSRAEKRSTFDRHEMLYFISPCAKLQIDGSPVLTEPSNVVEDAKMHMRVDWSAPIELTPGLHTIQLEVDVNSTGSGLWQSPSVRLYWSSEHFLREVVPSEHLISKN